MLAKQKSVSTVGTHLKKLAIALSMVLVFSMVFTSVLSVSAATTSTGDTVINFVEITDTHGNIYTTNNGKDEYRMAYLANTFNALRTTGKEDLVVLSGGDMFQGTAVSNLLKGTPVINAMNAMKFDAMALGNHEFDWGLDKVVQNGKLNNTEIPVLACNLYDKATNKLASAVLPYKIVEKEGKKIAIIGAVDDVDFPASILKSLIESYEFKDAATMINQYAKEIVDGKKADAVVVLAHIGAIYDKNVKANVGNLVTVIEKLNPKYVNAVFGGHSHQIITGVSSNGIPYGEGYKEGRGYVSMQMTFKADGTVSAGTMTYNSILEKDLCKPATGTNPNLDIAVTAITDKAIADIKPVTTEILATTPTDLTRTMSAKPYGDSSLGNWVTDLIRKDTKADFAFNNNGGIRADIQKGNVTMGDMYTIMPFDNTLVTVKMTGAQVVKLLEQGIQDVKGKGMQISGLTFQYDNSKPSLSRVFNVKCLNGIPIDLNKTYTVGTNNFMGTGGDNFDVFNDTNVKNSYVDTYIVARDSLVEAAKAVKVINASVDNRIALGTKDRIDTTTNTATTANTDTPTTTFVSDTTADFNVNGAYQLKITSTNGQIPTLVVGTAGVFNTQLVKTVGNDYYFMLTAIENPGIKAGIYVNGVKLLVATVTTPDSTVKSDTTGSFIVKVGKAYTFKITAESKPAFVVGTSSAFKVEFVTTVGKDYFFKVTAVGKEGAGSGFYINSQKTPVTVATISK